MTAAPADAATGADAWKSFARHRACVVGIDAYRNGISPLKTATADARRLAELLVTAHRFEPPVLLLDDQASAAGLRELLHTTLPQQLGQDDRVLFYFAGHGVALDDDSGPAGFLVPSDAQAGAADSMLPMSEVVQALDALPCRHLMVILDCCFAGAFRWAETQRAVTVVPKRIYQERFARYVADRAWQVITSSAQDQHALDVLGERGVAGAHSPFAQALFQALEGAADLAPAGQAQGDGIITATELYLYLRDSVEQQTLQRSARLRQTPGLFPLKKHDKGEFIFLHPHHALNLPPMQPGDSPYKGLASFEPADAHLFYGRECVVTQLHAMARDPERRLIVVTGASGSGKSSVVKAGLLPLLQKTQPELTLLPPLRPGTNPSAALQAALAGAPPNAVLVIDQLEEVVTRGPGPASQALAQFDEALAALLQPGSPVARVVVTVRSDFEPSFSRGRHLGPLWAAARLTVPPFSPAELRQVVQMPALQATMSFEPPTLVDRIVDEVAQSIGAIPMLSYAMSELFRGYLKRVSQGRNERTLTQQDLDALGGVVGAMAGIADRLHAGLQQDGRDHTLRRIMLRMVSLDGALASRRVAMADLRFADDDETMVHGVVDALVEARLLVRVSEDGQDAVEPAHDALVRAWPKVHEWIDECGRDNLRLMARVAAAAIEAERADRPGRRERLLWASHPSLYPARQALESGLTPFNLRERRFIEASVDSADRAGQAARQAATTARAGELAAMAASIVDTYPDRAILLAIESVRVAPTPLGVALVASARSAAPYRWVLRCRSGLRQASFAAAGRSLVIEGEKGSVSLWNAHTGRETEMRMLPGKKKRGGGSYVSITLSPDGLTLYTAEYEAIRSWNTVTGQQQLHIDLRWPRWLDCSPDGRWLAVLTDDGADDDPGPLHILDATTGELLHRARIGTKTGYLSWPSHAWLPDGSGILIEHAEEQLGLWTFAEGWRPLLHARTRDFQLARQASSGTTLLLLTSTTSTQLLQLPGLGTLLSLSLAEKALNALTPDGDTLISIDTEAGPGGPRHVGRIRRLQPARQAGSPAPDPVAHEWPADATRQLVVDDQGLRFAVLRADGVAELRDAGSGALLATLAGHEGRIEQLSFSADGRRIVTAGQDGAARVWDERGRPRQVLCGHEGALTGARFMPDGTGVMTLGGDATVRLWPLDALQAHRSWTTPQRFAVTQDRGLSSTLSPDGRRLATWSAGRVEVHDTAMEAPLQAFEPGRGDVAHAALSSDGQRVLALSADGTAQVWDVASGAVVALLVHEGGPIEEAILAPDGRQALGRSGQDALLWAVQTPPRCQVLKGHQDKLSLLRFSPDGQAVVTADVEGTVGVWDGPTGQRRAWLPYTGKRNEMSAGWIKGLALSHDAGRLLVCRSAGSEVLELPAGKAVLRLPRGTASLSPDGRWVAVCQFDDHQLHLWQVDGGREKPLQVGRGQRLGRARFSPDGRFLLLYGEASSRLELLDVASGRVLRALEPRCTSLWQAEFSADGRTIIAVGRDDAGLHYVEAWACHEAQPLDDLLAQAQAHVARELSPLERDMFGLSRGAAPR